MTIVSIFSDARERQRRNHSMVAAPGEHARSKLRERLCISRSFRNRGKETLGSKPGTIKEGNYRVAAKVSNKFGAVFNCIVVTSLSNFSNDTLPPRPPRRRGYSCNSSHRTRKLRDFYEFRSLFQTARLLRSRKVSRPYISRDIRLSTSGPGKELFHGTK